MATVARSVVSSVLRGSGTGSTVIRGAATASPVLCGPATGGAATGSTVVGGTATGSTVVGGTATGSTVDRGLRGSATGSTVDRGLRGSGIGPSRRGAVEVFTSPHGGVGFLARAGSRRHFSSSASSSIKEKFKAKWQKHKPGEDMMIVCTLLGTGSGLLYLLDTAYKKVLKESESISKAYIDDKLVDMKTDHKMFQNIATGTHHEFVRTCNDATAEIQAEVSNLRSRMLALEAKEFKYRKELLLAAEILGKADAAKSAEE